MAADPGAPSGVPVTGAQPQWGLVERCGRLTTLMVTAVLLPALWMGCLVKSMAVLLGATVPHTARLETRTKESMDLACWQV